MGHTPPKYYDATQAAHGLGHLLGIHFCALQEMTEKFGLVVGPSLRITAWKGNTVKAFNTFQEARRCWYDAGRHHEPRAHGC